ncbi:MAG: hypothetical protein KF708_08595 [Pirellulales bacterium]|nr:hypothetical protein [Pirellulales bacterium]
MSSPSVPHSNPATPRRRSAAARTSAQLKVSSYDTAAGWMISLLMLIGAAVASLFLIWLTSRIFVTQAPIPVLLEEIGGGAEDGVLGESMEIDAPDAEVISQESELTEPQIEQALDQITEVVATLQADLTPPAETDNVESGGGGKSHGDGRQVGRGSGKGEPGIPRAQRWEIFFQDGGTLESYARQLDFFKIELGVVGGTNQVQYAFRLAQPKPETRVGAAAEENRLYMTWRKGSLQQADQELVARAGLSSAGRLVVQFFPPETENVLANVERNFRGLEATKIRKTRFGVREAGAGYEFYVIDQTAF